MQNFLRSLEQGGMSGGSPRQSKVFTTLPDLLSTSETIPAIDSGSDEFIGALISHLPPVVLLVALDVDDIAEIDPNSEAAQSAIQTLTIEQKKDVLKRVLRSPQLRQSLGSLTMALRDGGLPTISEALKIKVENGGYIQSGAVPMGGGDAVEAFLEGVKRTVEEEDKKDENKMDTE